MKPAGLTGELPNLALACETHTVHAEMVITRLLKGVQCHSQDSDSGSDGMPRRGSRDSVGVEGIPVPDVSRRHQSANSCGKAERAVPNSRRAGLSEC